MTLPSHTLELTKDGKVFDPGQVEDILKAVPNITDLLVMSHGWNNDMADATQLYDALCTSLANVLALDIVPGLSGRTFAVLRVLWPSKKFTDEELIPGGGAALATPQNVKALNTVLDELKRDPVRLGSNETDVQRSSIITQAQQLIPRLESDVTARQQYVALLRSILNPADAHPDDGSEDFFGRDPLELFNELSASVVAPLATGGGGATAVGGTGGAAGLRDLFSGMIGAARRLANFTTYYQMKERAGTVGRKGLGPVLQQIRSRKKEVRLHLIGHSFGGRLVTAAAAVLAPSTPTVTMTLLQAAYSHNGLAVEFDGTHNGAFRALLAEKRVSGPVLITHTKNDTAVGIAYPLASRIARDKASALGDENDPYGGMGRNGAQHTPEVANTGGAVKRGRTSIPIRRQHRLQSQSGSIHQESWRCHRSSGCVCDPPRRKHHLTTDASPGCNALQRKAYTYACTDHRS